MTLSKVNGSAIQACHSGVTALLESGAHMVKFHGTQRMHTAASRSCNTLALKTSFPVR
jgi:hypothetical protein